MRNWPNHWTLPVCLLALLFTAGPALTPAAAQEDHFEPPADLDADSRRLFEEAVAAFEEAAEATHDSMAKLQGAIELFHKVRKEEPRFALPWFYLGIVYQWTEEFAEARIALNKCVKLQPDFHEAWVELADVHVWLKRFDDAIPLYDKALKLEPTYQPGWFRRGLAQVRMGEYEAGRKDLERALELTTDVAERAGVEEFLEKLRTIVDGPDWEAVFVCETDHYVVKTPVSQEFADFVGEQAELIHKLYTSIFPAIRRGSRKFPIVVYRNGQEYHQNGGPDGAGGHYSPIFRQLELFKYDDQADTLIVLYHEGFHQFLHDYLEKAPQWFNEGIADYFGPSEEVKKGDRTTGMRIRANPWRLRTIKQAIRSGRHPSLHRLLHMTQAEMYQREMAGIHYAQAWSFIHFLCEYQNRKYFPVLKHYFNALRKGKGQGEAYDDSFGRVDMVALEAEWKKHVLALTEAD